MTPAWLRDLGGADAYQLLGTARAATTDEILRAHRRRIRELHPDRVTGDAAQARLVNLARDILLDPVRRAEYDRLVDQPAAPEPPGSSWSVEDVVVGAEPPPTPPSAWETEDVTVGAEPPPEPEPSLPPEPLDWPYQPDYQPSYYQEPSYYNPAIRPSLGLPIAAIAVSVAVLLFSCLSNSGGWLSSPQPEAT